MSDRGAWPELGISVIGSFRVLARNGEDLTPRGRKARALLAILALTPTRRRSRAALQDKLWSDRGPDQGADSMRQTLSEIRRAFGEHYRSCLVSDMRGVGLAEGRVTVDLDSADLSELERAIELPQLLEDIDVADPQFEDWLRNQRAAFEQRVMAFKSAGAADPPVPGPVVMPRRAVLPVRPWVRLLPPLTVNSESGYFLSRLIADRIAQGLVDGWAIDIRDDAKGSEGIQLRVDAIAISRDVAINVVLLAADGTTQL